MKQNEIIPICLVLLLAFVLRFYDLTYPSFMWGDESGIVPAATNYWDTGQSEPDRWEHPPFRHIILYAFIRFLGDNPYGWRIMNVLFGSFAVVLTYFFAREITGEIKAATMAALLLATDPLHIVLSRYPAEEIFGGAFFLAAVFIYLISGSKSIRLLLSALFMGCALATKWYYVPSWFIIYAMALRKENNYRNAWSLIFITSVYLLFPLSVYILSHYQWFGRGYSLGELTEYIVNAYYSLQGLGPDTYDSGMIFLRHLSAGEWFVRPVIVGMGTYIGADKGEFILFMNNLPIWILTIPAMIMTAVAAIKKRTIAIAQPVLFFCAIYMLFLLTSRPAFIYSAATTLPFAFTAIAYAVSLLAGRFAGGRYCTRFFYTVLALMVAWNLYIFPLATAKKINVDYYRYILNNGDINIH